MRCPNPDCGHPFNTNYQNKPWKRRPKSNSTKCPKCDMFSVFHGECPKCHKIGIFDNPFMEKIFPPLAMIKLLIGKKEVICPGEKCKVNHKDIKPVLVLHGTTEPWRVRITVRHH